MASIHTRTLADGVTKRYDVAYRDPDGEQRWKTYKRWKAANAFASTVEADKVRGQWLDPNAGKVTFQQYATEWLEIQTFDVNTGIQVECRLRVHVFPVLGKRQLRNIKPSTIQGWVKSMDTLAPYTQLLIFGHVQTILSAAIDDEMIAKNPCRARSVTKPRRVPTKVIPWESPVVSAMRDALPDRYSALVTLGAGLGLRQGECFGLSPDDIDWGEQRVQVVRQVKLVKATRVFAPPKYGKERWVPFPDSVGEWLLEYMERWPVLTVTLPWKEPQSKEQVTVRLVVTTRESNALEKGYINQHIWKPALVKIGVDPIRRNMMHVLRHTFASVLLDEGENIKAVSEYLGHADAGFTLRTYTHLMGASPERTRKAIDSMFGSSNGLTNI